MMKDLGQIFLEASQVNSLGVSFWNLSRKSEFFSYEHLYKEALKIAGALQQEGLQKGQRVAIMLPTHPDFLATFFGILLSGGVPCAFYPPLRLGKIEEWKERTRRQFVNLKASFVLTEGRTLGILGTPLRDVQPVPQCFQVKNLLARGCEGVPVPLEMKDTAFIQFSSGTTGNPKPVVITHENLFNNASTIVSMFSPEAKRKGCVSWLPLYHDMGLVGCLISSLLAKSPLHLIPPENFLGQPKIWLDVITLTQSGVTVAPNFAFGLCVNKVASQAEGLQGLNLSSLEVVLCGAEMVHPPTLQKFMRAFAPVGFPAKSLTPVYGLAEVTLAATFSSLDSPPVWTSFSRKELEEDGLAIEIGRFKGFSEGDQQGEVEEEKAVTLASLGKPLPGMKIEIRDEKNQVLPEGRQGNIWIHGPSIMQGYLDQTVETAQVLQSGWLKSGDIGFLIQEELYIFGRSKDIVIIRGRNLDPSFIETAVSNISGTRKGCAVAFGDFDESLGTERLVLLVEVTGNDEMKKGKKHFFISHESLVTQQEKLKNEIEKEVLSSCHIAVSEVQLLLPGTLPRTSSGKIQRNEAKKLWKKGQLKPPLRWVWGSFLKETLLGYWNHQRIFKRI